MLDAGQLFFFYGRYDTAVFDDCRSGSVLMSGNPQQVHN
jgi:hypothetical protein